MAFVNFELFLAASVLLILTPGQDLYLVMTRSVAQGPRAGMVTAAGVASGLLGHTLVVSIGLGALIHASKTLFLGLKLVGAAYLIWLGTTLLFSAGTRTAGEPAVRLSLKRLYLQGAISNLANPKIVVFYLAFLPQFVTSTASSPALSLFLLGFLFAALTFLIKAPIGYAAGALSGLFRRRPSIQTWINRLSGVVLVSLGLRLLVERPVH
jgi:threonine/homoserine/homoserine lactone efflux protein